jgi:hypothetical protein
MAKAAESVRTHESLVRIAANAKPALIAHKIAMTTTISLRPNRAIATGEIGLSASAGPSRYDSMIPRLPSNTLSANVARKQATASAQLRCAAKMVLATPAITNGNPGSFEMVIGPPIWRQRAGGRPRPITAFTAGTLEWNVIIARS